MFILKNKSPLAVALALSLSTLVATSAHAAAITLPPEMTDALASVAVIGAAVFAIAVGVKLYKWIRAAL